MDIKQLRYLNSRYLLKNQSMGISNFAEIIGRSQSLASAYVGENPTKNIGDKIARLIESKFEMPYGWLDREHEETNLAHTVGEPKSTYELMVSEPPPKGLLYELPGNKELLNSMHTIRDQINTFKTKIDSLNRAKNIAMQDLESVSGELIASNLAKYGLKEIKKVDLESQELSATLQEYLLLQKASESQYDLLFADREGNMLGVYTWVVLIKQYRTPLPTFNIDLDHPSIDARLGLVVFDGNGFNLFIIPVADLLPIDNPVLILETAESEYPELTGKQDEDGQPEEVLRSEIYIRGYKINNLDISKYKNDFDIKLNKLSSREQMVRMKSYLEAKIQDLGMRLAAGEEYAKEIEKEIKKKNEEVHQSDKKTDDAVKATPTKFNPSAKFS